MATKKDLAADLNRVAELFARKTKKRPSEVTRDFFRQNTEYSESAVTKHWGSFKVFKDKGLELKFNRGYMEDLRKSTKRPSKGFRTHFVTAAIEGQSLNRKFFQAYKTFEAHMDAELSILPMLGPNGKSDGDYHPSLEDLKDKFVVEYNYGGISAVDMKLNPQQTYPLTSMKKYVRQHESMILSNPKQHMKMKAGQHSIPDILHSTGACTNPDNYRITRQGQISKKSHQIGGLILEIHPDHFFIRQVQYLGGGFYDLDKYYGEDGKVRDIQPGEVESIYAGDIHAGWIAPAALQALYEQIELLQPERLMVGDVFDGSSISHHTENNIVAQVNRRGDINTLEKELTEVLKFFQDVVKRFPKLKIYAIKGNHEEHLDRYLTEQRWQKDRFNYRTALECLGYLLDEKDPIKEWCLARDPSLAQNVIWLTRDSTLRLTALKIENALHGDIANDGKKGSPKTLSEMAGRITHGHTHTPHITDDVWGTGTTTIRELTYRKGVYTTWCSANVVHYKNGQRQMLINTSYKEPRWRTIRV
jgi:hypothetical protein